MTHLASLAPGRGSPWPHYCPHPQPLQLLAVPSNHSSKAPSLTCPRGEVLPRREHKGMKSGAQGESLLLKLEKRR